MAEEEDDSVEETYNMSVCSAGALKGLDFLLLWRSVPLLSFCPSFSSSFGWVFLRLLQPSNRCFFLFALEEVSQYAASCLVC
jgi:hypothetical protein